MAVRVTAVRVAVGMFVAVIVIVILVWSLHVHMPRVCVDSKLIVVRRESALVSFCVGRGVWCVLVAHFCMGKEAAVRGARLDCQCAAIASRW